MKKNIFLLTTILFLIATVALAQKENKAKTTFGIKAGLNFTNVKAEDGSTGNPVTNNKIKAGINAGFFADVPCSNTLYFQPALIFSSKGTVNKPTDNDKTTISAGYIEAPLNFIYKSKGADGGFIIGGGPYVAYGISGIVKERTASYKESAIKYTKIDNINTNDAKNVYYLKPFDAGLNALIGYQGKSGVLIQFSGQLGLLNQALDSRLVKFNVSEYNNYGFGFSVGYKF